MKPIAVVILNWNGAAMLRRFLPSVLRSAGELATVYVADNGSTDDSRHLVETEFPEAVWLPLDRNYGFAGGYNRALRQIKEAYYMLLNSDVETPADWLRPLHSYMEQHAEVAACQPKLLCECDHTRFEYAGGSGGFMDWLGYPFCRGRVFADVETDQGQYNEVTTVFWATGAALLIRRDDFWQVGGFDDRFFAHMEEIDLCWRLRSRGREIVCIPDSEVYHVGGGTLPQGNPRKTFLNFRNNLLMLYKNLPQAELRSVFTWRMLLDFVAVAQFGLTGRWGECRAVFRAWKAFRKLRQEVRADRIENLKLTRCVFIRERVNFSLLWRYYVKRQRTFTQLMK